MNTNVLKHEPAKALFVTDDDPLKFYSCIIEFGKEALATNGAVFFEINEAFGMEVTKLLEKSNFHKIASLLQKKLIINFFIFTKKSSLS